MNVESVTILRSGGNLTVKYHTKWSDGCEVVQRTRATYADARVLSRNPQADTCPHHRRAA